MSPLPRARLAVLAAAAALLGGAAACVGKRERLSPPTVRLVLFDRTAVPGGRIRGTVTALDANSGIVAISARATTGDSTFLERDDYFATDSIDFGFELYVPTGAAAGTPIVITATAVNDQLLSRQAVDTAHVEAAPPPPP